MKHNLVIDGVGYRIRPITLNDAQFVVDVRLQDYERNKYIYAISSDVKIQEQWLDNYFNREGDYYFVIENKLTSEKEGLIGIYKIKENKAEWGRWVLKKGSMAAIESVDLIFKVAFNNLHLDELYCRTIEDNRSVVSFHNSIPQLNRGVLKDAIALDGTIYNAVEHYTTPAYYQENLQTELEKKALMIFQRNFRSLFGKLEFHHIGVATKNIEKEFSNYRFLGYSREGTVFEDKEQGIRGMFITAEGQPRLELLENLPESKTLDMFINNKNKMYHFAYKVNDIEKIVAVLNRNHIKTISPLKLSTYFEKRICFLVLPNLFMIELIEN